MPHIPGWGPLSEAVLSDQRAHYDRRRGTYPVGGWARVPVVLSQAPRPVVR